MPQLNPDEAANDEPKTYNLEDGENGWQDSKDLNDIKGDLVEEDDGDPIPQLYDNKANSHRNEEGGHRNKDSIERDHQKEIGSSIPNFPYSQQDIGSIVSGLSRPIFPSSFLPPSAANLSSLLCFMAEIKVILAYEKNQLSIYQNFGNAACDYTASLYDVLRQREMERAVEQIVWLEKLREDISRTISYFQSQVSYPPYMGSYMGSLFCGASSPIDLDGKQGPPRAPQSDVPQMYPLPGQLGQVPNPLVSWSPGPLYPLCTASAMAGMLRYPYPFPNFSSTSGAMGSVSPFPLVPPHPHAGGLHPNMLHPGGLPLPGHMMNGQSNGGGKTINDKKTSNPESAPPKRTKSDKPSRPYVKKPLNAFMIYMKEQRAQVVAECTLKESAAINQILGRKWHSLNRDEQQKYYEMARKERQLHMQMFPGWSARDNYGKRKKRKKEKTQDCTAASYYGRISSTAFQQPHFHRQSYDLAPRRKKKCIRYQHDGDDSDDSDASLGPYQGSPDGSYSFDSGSQSGLPQSSSATGNSDQMRPPPASERLSPVQPMTSDQIKQEKSPPLPHDPNVPCSNDKNADNMYHPPTSSFNSATNEASSSSSSAHTPTSSSKKPSRSSDAQNNSLPKSSENFRLPTGNLNGFPLASKTGPDGRNRRSNSSHPESPLNNTSNRQNMFNSPLLSPAAMGLNSPHSNPLLPPQFSYLAANLPTSPIGSFMGFSGFKGLTSPMNMGLSGPGASVAPGGHPGSSATRRPSSALEGKS